MKGHEKNSTLPGFTLMWNILVSGASGIVGYGILRSLKKSGKELRLIGTTIYNDSVAQGFCDIFEQAPPLVMRVILIGF